MSHRLCWFVAMLMPQRVAAFVFIHVLERDLLPTRLANALAPHVFGRMLGGNVAWHRVDERKARGSGR